MEFVKGWGLTFDKGKKGKEVEGMVRELNYILVYSKEIRIDISYIFPLD